MLKILEKYNTTFEEVVEQWLRNKKIEIKNSTYSNYKYTIYKYIMPKLQNKTLSDLKKYNFNELVEELKEELSAKTIKDIICILKAIFNYIEENFSCKLKTTKIVLPKVKTQNVKIFSKKEREKLENYCLKQKGLKELGIVMCLNTGLRIGEICALRWENIDLDKRVICVRKTMERIYNDELKNTKVIIDEPKSQKSIREIPISNKLYEVLKQFKKEYKDTDFFLSGESEKYVEPRNYENIYKKILKKCNVKVHKFHTIRHTFATDCIRVGMDTKSLSEILGHSNVNITLNRYVHSSYEVKKKFLEKL